MRLVLLVLGALAGLFGAEESAFAFRLPDGKGGTMDLSRHAGSVVLVVNLASRSGSREHLAGLQALHQRFADQGLVVLGLPCDDFFRGAPEPDGEIQDLLRHQQAVDFTLLGHVHVRGRGVHPFYDWVSHQGKSVTWNFAKVLIDREGRLIEVFDGRVLPEDAAIVAAIQIALDR